MSLTLLLLSIIINITFGIDNGLGRKPPLGWRSWNAYHHDISQDLMMQCIDAMLDKSREVNGTPMSLYDVGYHNFGVDDTWQLCETTGANAGHYFHNASAPNGWANINMTRFPDLKSMIEYAHSKGLNVGWYFNNCQCSEHEPYPANEVNDVKFLRYYDFDGVKLDGCSSSKNISNWQYLINTTSNKPLLTENCHNGPNYGNTTWCPMNFFRSSTDINTNYPDIIGVNLNSTLIYQDYPNGYISRPGCWAYPDMLEVGNIPNQEGANNTIMDQSHFSAWSIVSAPLILGFDLTNNATLNRVWDIITNLEVLNVSQNWAGHPGRRIKAANYTLEYKNMKQHEDHYGKLSEPNVAIYGYEIWAKPQPDDKYAVLLMNNDGYNAQDITVDFNDIPWSGSADIRDIIQHKDLGTFSNSYTTESVPPFGSTFLLFSKST